MLYTGITSDPSSAAKGSTVTDDGYATIKGTTYGTLNESQEG